MADEDLIPELVFKNGLQAVHATVTEVAGTAEAAQQAANSAASTAGTALQSVVAGTNVTVDDTDPINPVISASGGGGDGDMEASVYDPTGVEGDAFDYGNMHSRPTLAPVATSGSYNDLDDTPTLGTAAAADTDDFATAAQGAAADTAVQPGDTGTMTWVVYDDEADARPSGVGRVVWTPSDNELGDPTNADELDIVWRSGEVATPNNVFVHDGDEYVQAEVALYVGPVEPPEPVNGDRWVDPDNAVHYVWWDVEWIVLAGDGPEPTAPGQVTGLTATPGIDQVLLEWDNPASGGDPITDYVIERAPDNEGVPGSWATLTDGTSTDTDYTDTEVTGGSTYWYRVSAVNGVGTGPASDAVDVTPDVAPSLYVVATGTDTYTSSTPLIDFDGYVPVEGDVIIFWAMHNANLSLDPNIGTIPWTVVAAESSTGTTSMCVCYWHVVTSTEESNGTTEYGDRIWQNSASGDGDVVGVVIRGADTTSPVDAFGVSNSGTVGSVSTHVLPGITGPAAGCLVLAGIGIRNPATTLTPNPPTGWTLEQATEGTQMQGGVYSLDEFTDGGDVAQATMSTAPEARGYSAVSVAIAAGE